ncbi:DUF4181 domain-containing protein [Bacillus sp. NTK071]|uniref:DUF4181 domain-containing protein n=1 Tax=Bacillus sp. NTK071 TaxID=2802175 RepID=UPI001A8EDF37|nr:DUF4181 domain-containing protein [Bacillus sp. NTK071]MBN8211023.1 DUF4181 domain-containing protein [Bacillus sp. NTK071]
MYGVGSDFWLKLVLLIIILVVLNFVFSAVMRRRLRVEKRKFFSYNHVNILHSKVDWSIRITFMVVMIVGAFYNVTRLPAESLWYLEAWFVLFVFLVITESVQAIFEWKYATNRKDYMYTLSQLSFNVILIIAVFSTDFLWLG